jgi:hypothetical protein
MPDICCEADKIAKSPRKYHCSGDGNGFYDMEVAISCSKNEGVCDASGRTTFHSDEL